ncbi:MAG: hypothetical protein FJX65_04345 [Alphaproteobacteria bacterium]|nr:hypothetical protein [Alphaproteobacteria bacterium]
MSVEQLAGLLRERRALEQRIATLTGRGAERDDIGRAIAGAVFDLKFGSDGVATFGSGPLAGKSVDVRW